MTLASSCDCPSHSTARDQAGSRGDWPRCSALPAGGRRVGHARQAIDAKREEYRPIPAGRRAGDGDRLTQPPARDRLRRGRLDHARARLLRADRLRDARRHLQHPAAQGRALLQSLRRCRHAVHAAPHLVGHRAACRRAARLSGLARLRAHAARFRRASVRRDQARHARRRHARRHRARSTSPIRCCSSRRRAQPVSRWRRRPSVVVLDADAAAARAASEPAAIAAAKAAEAAGRDERLEQARRGRRRRSTRRRRAPTRSLRMAQGAKARAEAQSAAGRVAARAESCHRSRRRCAS